MIFKKTLPTKKHYAHIYTLQKYASSNHILTHYTTYNE